MATVLPVAGCANVNAQLNPAKRHHTPDGFKNNYTSGGAKSPADLFRWQHQRLRDGLPKAPQTPTPVAAPLLEFDQSKAVAATMRPAITWAAHATMLVQANGLHVSADPIFSERASPVQHWSARRVAHRSQTLWGGGWAFFGSDTQRYFSGDTGYSQDFLDPQKRFADRQTPANGGGFDIVLIAAGAYEPHWFMKKHHVNPAEAVQVHKDLKAKRSVGVHWGTFTLIDQPLDQPPKELATAVREQNLAKKEFTPMAIGKTRTLPSRMAL